MNEQGLRLGDLLDDYCLRCRHLLNHAVASMMNGQVVKVICQSCYTEHAYQHGEGGKKKANSRTTLFDQVLAKFSSSDVPPAPDVPKKSAAEARSITRHKGNAPRGKK
jgi:hypothetical protein